VQNTPNGPDDVDSDYPEFAHSEPFGDGMPLAVSTNKSAAAITSATPVITISPEWQGQDNIDMKAMVDESVAIMGDARFVEYGTALKVDYPKAWFADTLGFGDAEQVATMVHAPTPPIRYVAATVLPFDGWAVTGGREGRVNIQVNRALLTRWRSPDVVMRACAINTMAHEISHTLSRSATQYRFAFTDTGVGREARKTPPASYITGNVALCSYLVRQGRIDPAKLNQCVKIWYKPKGFQSNRCNDFPGDTPVE
jgi:hypothetical protein